MFPLKDNIPAKYFPAINLWLIIINVLCFLFELNLGDRLPYFIAAYGFVPAKFLEQQANNWFDLSRFLPVFYSMFLHGNWLHLISNMWMLWIFGDNVEDTMGHGRYLSFYLLCGVASIFAQTLANPASTTPMIGASGAISGVVGAYFLLYPRAKILTFVPIFFFFYLLDVPAFIFIGLWFLMQFLQGTFQILTVGRLAEGGVAWWAHVGGFGAGLALVHLFTRRSRRIKRRQNKIF